MGIFRDKSFWTFMAGINVTSAMICAFAGSQEGILICSLAFIMCVVSSYLVRKP